MRTLLVLASLSPVLASATTFGFDDAEALLYDGSNAATASTLDNRYGGISLSHYRPLDADGNYVGPYERVTAISYADWGLPPVSGVNALDGSGLGSLVVDLNPKVFPLGSSFGISVVDQGFGDANATVRFYDAVGGLVDTVGIDLSRGGRFTYGAKPFASVVLPQGAFYDDLTVSPVPEPASLAALGLGAAALLRRRRR